MKNTKSNPSKEHARSFFFEKIVLQDSDLTRNLWIIYIYLIKKSIKDLHETYENLIASYINKEVIISSFRRITEINKT